MNRLDHIKRTLISNLENNSSYENLEVILLDYNSEDGLGDWVKKNCSHYLESGRLIYCKTLSPTSWNPSHAKNIAFKLASGDIICNVWADYLTGVGFADYVNMQFQNNSGIVLTPIDIEGRAGQVAANDSLGMVCVKREDFLSVCGFDERMDIHGFEDYDFIFRLGMLNVVPVQIDARYLGYLQHSDNIRFSIKELSGVEIYLNFISSFSTGVLILLADGSYEEATLIRNRVRSSDNIESAYKATHRFEYSLDEGKWKKGGYNRQGGSIFFDGNPSVCGVIDRSLDKIRLCGSERHYSRLKNNQSISNLLEFRHFYKTRVIMEDNVRSGNWLVNADFGIAEVVKGMG